MMNRSPIQWCEFSWNPVTGCYHNCPYCYARRQARRFCGDVRLNVSGGQMRKAADTSFGPLYYLPKPFKGPDGKSATMFPAGFTPTFHEYRLTQPLEKKKPANIFVCSMSDLFGEWVPDEWIRRVFEACEAAPWHNYLFLTKNPGRLQKMYAASVVREWNAIHPENRHPQTDELSGITPLPQHDNWWWGSTVTKPHDRRFQGGIGDHTFLSIEPLHGYLDAGLGSFGSAEWIIVGAETGNRRDKVTPKREWIENIIEAARITHAKVLLKDSREMREVWGGDLITEYPEAILRIKQTYGHGRGGRHG